MTTMTYLGDRFRELFEAAGITQQDFALDIRMDTGLVSKILTGTRRPEKYYSQLASHPRVKVSVDELKSWHAVDVFGPNVIQAANKWLQKHPQDKLSIGITEVEDEQL